MVAGLLVAPIALAGFRGARWPHILMLVTLLFIVSGQFRFEVREVEGADWQSFLKLGIYSVATIWGFLALRERARLLHFPYWALGAFATLALLSVSYSPVPLFTFYAAVTFSGLFMFSLAATERLPEATLVQCVVVATAAHVLIALCLLALAPDLAIDPRFAHSRLTRLEGVSGHPNVLGWTASLLVIALLLLYRNHGLSTLAFLSLLMPGLAALALTWSRTSMVALALTLLAITVRRRLVPLIGLVFVSVVVILLTTSLDSGVSVTDLARWLSRSGDPQEVLQVTGRTTIWATGIREYFERPILGVGYGAIRELAAGRLGTAHNLLLDTLLTTGLVGVALLLAVLVKQVIDLYHRPSPFRDAVFVYALLVGLTEPSIAAPVPNVLTLTWLLSLFSACRHREHPSKPA